MYCNKCNTKLVDGKCPNCYDPFLEMQMQDTRKKNEYEKQNSVLLIASIVLLIISIFPLHPILMWIGVILSIAISIITVIIRKKERDTLQPFVLIFSSVSFVSLVVWLYFIYFVADKF